MSRKEHPFVWYYNKNLHFAELINGWLFRGSDRLTADDISDSDRRILTRKGRNQYKDRFPQELTEYVTDYRIHVLDICHTSDERLEEFPPDIRTMFLFIKYKDDPDTLMKKLSNAEDVCRDTCEAIVDMVGERRLKKVMPEEEGAKVCMCKAIDILIKDGEKRGELRGFERGTAQERKNTELQRKNAEQQRKRAEKAEARIRELERMLKL